LVELADRFRLERERKQPAGTSRKAVGAAVGLRHMAGLTRLSGDALRLTGSAARLCFGRGFITRQSSHFYGSNVNVIVAVRVCESTSRFGLELEAGEPLLETNNSCGYSRAARDTLVATLGYFTHMTKSTQSNPPKFRFSNIF